MKLYCHPASTTSRGLMLFAAEARLPLDLQIVDLFSGEHCQEAFVALNPNRLVPVLEDGSFRLTESSAILKYLADQAGSALYPREPQARARVHERMDWINTQLNRDLAYGLVYPQVFATHRRPSDEAQRVHLAWAQERARTWLAVMDQHLLEGEPAWLANRALSIADLYAAPFVALAELVGSDLAATPRVREWLSRLKALSSWRQVFEAIDGYAATLDRAPMLKV